MGEKEIRQRIEKIDSLRKAVATIEGMLDGMYRADNITMEVPRTVRRRFRYDTRVQEYTLSPEEIMIFRQYLTDRRAAMKAEAAKLSSEFES